MIAELIMIWSVSIQVRRYSNELSEGEFNVINVNIINGVFLYAEDILAGKFTYKRAEFGILGSLNDFFIDIFYL